MQILTCHHHHLHHHWRYDFFQTLSILCSLLMYSSSTALTCLQTAAHSSINTIAKFCSASCWISHGIKVTFFAAILVFTIPQIFLWGLNQDGREVVCSLCVHARWTINCKSHIAVYAFLWDCTALLLSCRNCTVCHAYPTRTAFHLFWHCWLGSSWAVHCGKMHCRPQ